MTDGHGASIFLGPQGVLHAPTLCGPNWLSDLKMLAPKGYGDIIGGGDALPTTI